VLDKLGLGQGLCPVRMKVSYNISVIFFELGSAICVATPDNSTLVVGSAICIVSTLENNFTWSPSVQECNAPNPLEFISDYAKLLTNAIACIECS
jgi:hypothetical protein